MERKTEHSHVITIRPLCMEDYKFVSRWSEDEEFCKANGWESNKNERELYEW